jgi:2-polyprenyl-3-methyl-5-hydroxy-6-metoxy-1,4-benzoquinol methylase/spore coat polysaccharide biosynthesis predicted glycosyltransferase SpsG
MGNIRVELSESKLIFIPKFKPGDGTGHIKRSAILAEKLYPRAFFPQSYGTEVYSDYFRDSHSILPKNKIRFIDDLEKCSKSDILVIDRRACSKNEIIDLSRRGIIIGLDEGGVWRNTFPYLIDTLPGLNLSKNNEPNIMLLHNSKVSEQKKNLAFPFKKILVTFGGEDRNDLSMKFISMLVKAKLIESYEITLIEGPYFKKINWIPGIKIVRKPDSIEDFIEKSDLVVTHYGLTCYEALSLGTPVILFNPSDYHRRLSIRNHIPQIGVNRPDANRFKWLISRKNIFEELLANANSSNRQKSWKLHELIDSLHPASDAACPVCRKERNRSIARFADRTYFKCGNCGIVYLLIFKENTIEYNESYFNEEYKKQYGKTYIEDFDNIREIGRTRVFIIEKILKKIGSRSAVLLDIGCAFGPFLVEAKNAGFRVTGCDISEKACDYVSGRLKEQCYFLDFEKADNNHEIFKRQFGVITMWYVIEHFKSAGSVLRRINRLLDDKGIFAFSTPNASGISGRKDRGQFLFKSPSDHITVWSFQSAKKILRFFGFRVVKIKNTGHHPERFLNGREIKNKTISGILRFASRLLMLGDTFEVYAVKVREV